MRREDYQQGLIVEYCTDENSMLFGNHRHGVRSWTGETISSELYSPAAGHYYCLVRRHSDGGEIRCRINRLRIVPQGFAA